MTLPIGTRVRTLSHPYDGCTGTVETDPDENGWINVILDDHAGHARWFYRYEMEEL